jgi:predicted N-formylglutamate amidohydrolase
VFTCEHASNTLPEPWSWPEEDEWITDTHWAFDIGAADVTRRLVERTGSVGILAKFSRLLVDPNRDLGAASLYRRKAEGRTLRLNHNMSSDELERRVQEYYHPYHEVVDHWIGRTPEVPVIAIHTFTPVFDGEVRTMEVGVLYDHSEELGLRMADALREAGLKVALNAPYSGKNGMMFSAYRHADEHNRDALELELRQDMLASPAHRAAMADQISVSLARAGVI